MVLGGSGLRDPFSIGARSRVRLWRASTRAVPDAFMDAVVEPGPTAENEAQQWRGVNLVAQLFRLFAFVSFGSTLCSFLCLCGLTHRRLM
jgi:hypothetical protein